MFRHIFKDCEFDISMNKKKKDKIKGKISEKKSKAKKKVKQAKEKTIKELVLNVPTFLNALRIILTFVVAYMIIVESNPIKIVAVFIIAALTDWFDGKIARKYKLSNRFGAKADMVADRFLWIGTAITLMVVFGMNGIIGNFHAILLLLMLMREIIAAPFAFLAAFSGHAFPNARFIAKVTTFLQGVGFPAWILSIYYPTWIYLAVPTAIATAITGTISGILYTKDIKNLE